MAVERMMTKPTEAVEEDPLLLYEPIHNQINIKKIPWTESYEFVTPDKAQEWLNLADAYQNFRQRPRTKARKARWLSLYQTSRYAFFNPMAPLCFSPDGILMNGGNRLGALAEHDAPVGFKIIRNCPVWLMNYFDNGNMRTARESIHINGKKVTQDTQPTVRLGMRYEEFIFGKRGDLGWTKWGTQKDENVDIDNFMNKRSDLTDLIGRGVALRKRTDNLQVASATNFIFYQQLAWPEGQEKLEAFLDALLMGAMLTKGNAALTIREWLITDGFIGGYTHGRREGQLLLLFKHFTMFCEDIKNYEVRVARGLPMTMPYHPDGWDVACKNVREALVALDDA